MGAEAVELFLQLADGCGWWPGAQPALQGLVEPFDLALGLWMPRVPVLLADAEDRQEVLERVAATSEPGCVDAAIVCERRGWDAVKVDGL
jgi:hypothetical protein